MTRLGLRGLAYVAVILAHAAFFVVYDTNGTRPIGIVLLVLGSLMGAACVLVLVRGRRAS